MLVLHHRVARFASLCYEQKEADSLPHPDCEDCQRLWREYSTATTDHIRLGSKLRLAALERDLESIGKLTLQVEAAELARAAVREAIRQHEAESHPMTEAAEA